MVTDDLFSKPVAGEVEIGRESTQRLVDSDQFYTKHFTPAGREFFIFAEIGDYLKGILLGGSRDNSHINRTKSYQIKAYEARQHGIYFAYEDGRIEEFFANRQLQRFISAHELARRCVRIVFIGRQKSGWGGHSAKVYRVFIDEGTFTEMESECYEPNKRTRKSRKPASSTAGR